MDIASASLPDKLPPRRADATQRVTPKIGALFSRLSMNRTFSLIFLSLGTILLIYSFNAVGSLRSALAAFPTGVPTDHAVWLMIAGTILFGVGIGGAVFGRKPTWTRT